MDGIKELLGGMDVPDAATPNKNVADVSETINRLMRKGYTVDEITNNLSKLLAEGEITPEEYQMLKDEAAAPMQTAGVMPMG